MKDLAGSDTCARCQKCDRHRVSQDYVHEPWLLWDKFPCPPPGSPKAHLLVQLNWTGYLGPRDGCKAFKRVAARCNVDLTRVQIPVSLSYCEGVYTVFGLCGTQCVIAIILACICLMFVFILVIVCYRYVHRADKGLKSTCSKVESTEHQNNVNTLMNRYYVQSQYYYKAGNIPDRRGLPYEVRCTENGVEARLLKSIKQIPLKGYHFDDTCSQCRHAASIHSTLSSNRSLQDYEKTYWQDQAEGTQRGMPSNDSLVHRRQFDRQSSIIADMSHSYECISDSTPNVTYARRCNHSMANLPRNSSSNIREVPCYQVSRCSDDDRVLVLSGCVNTEIEMKNNPHREVLPYKANSFTRHYNGNYGRSPDRNVHHGSLKDQCCCTYEENRAAIDRLQHSTIDVRSAGECSKLRCMYNSVEYNTTNGHCLHNNVGDKFGQIPAYKYTYNPTCDYETTRTSTISKNDQFELSSSSCTPSELEYLSSKPDSCDTNSSPKSIAGKCQFRTANEQINKYSGKENASLLYNMTSLKNEGMLGKDSFNK